MLLFVCLIILFINCGKTFFLPKIPPKIVSKLRFRSIYIGTKSKINLFDRQVMK